MISKELLSEVLKKEIKEKYNGSYEFVCNGVSSAGSNEVSSTLAFYDSEIDFSINIYELAHKCKEWAYNNFGLNIFIEKHTFDLYEASIKICRFKNKFGSYNSFYFYYPKENTEVQAIIKACEWIYKELNK